MDKRLAPVSIGVVDDEKGAARELVRVLTIIKRALLKWPLSLVLVIIGVSAAVGYSVVRKPTYTSETIVVYRQGVKMTTEAGGQSLSLGVRLQEMLLARSRLERVLDELEIYQDVKAKLGPVEAVEAFRSDITFKARSTDTFSISYKGHDPALAQRVTEGLARSLIEENQRLRVDQAKTQREFLEAQKTQAGTSLKEKERIQARFLAEHPEFALDANAQNTGASIRATSQQKTSQPKDKTLAALERQAERNRVLLEGGVPTPSAPDPGDPALEAAVSQARQSLAAAQGELAAKKAKFGDNYPDVISAQNRVNEAQGKLKGAEDAAREARNANAASVPSSDPEANKERLRSELNSLNAEIEKRKKLLEGKDSKAPVDAGTDEADRVVGLETEWARLSRDVGESRDQMNELERNYFRAQIEASSSLGGYSDQVVVLDPAFLPTRPNPPGKQMLVMIGFGVSFVIAMLIAILRAVLDTRIYEESDLARVAPILTVVPRSGSRRWFARG